MAPTPRATRLASVLAAVTLAVLIGACGGGATSALRCRAPRTMKAIVQTSDRLNLDDTGRSLATVLRLYQLKGIARFEGADFEEIWLQADATLEDELVKVEEVTLFPSERVTRSLELAADVAYVVAVALFRQPAGVSWRNIYQLPLERCGSSGASPVTRRYLLEDSRIEVRVAPQTGKGK